MDDLCSKALFDSIQAKATGGGGAKAAQRRRHLRDRTGGVNMLRVSSVHVRAGRLLWQLLTWLVYFRHASL
ncbi:hypothetical protein INR49_011266 [Caranx melampygus]|nr:hypothetical protein INR49_011266 [Caranx melampygus]